MRLPVTLLLMASLSTAGCGGEDEKTSASSTSTPTATATAAADTAAEGPTEKEWKADVTAICKKNRQEAQKVVADVQSEGLEGADLAAEVLDRSVPYQGRLVKQLGEVEAPGAIAEDYRFFVERLGEALPLLKSTAEAIRKRQKKALQTLQRKFTDVAADTRPFALKHGLRACLPDQS